MTLILNSGWTRFILGLLLLSFNYSEGQNSPEPTRPLPQKDNTVVKELIDQLLGDPDDGSPLPATPVPFPLNLINSSNYWSVENLQPAGSNGNMKEGAEWLEGYLHEADEIYHLAAAAGWSYFTNLTSVNRRKLVDSENVLGLFIKSTAAQARQFDLQSFAQNSTLQRLLQILSVEGLAALPDDRYEEYNLILQELAEDFTNGAVCERGRPPPCTQRYSQLQHVMSLSREPEELTYLWLAWRNAVGPTTKDTFTKLVQLSNEGAKINGYMDAGELWRSPYEESAPLIGRSASMNLTEELDRLYQQMLPLYLELHTYVRRQLAEAFPPLSVPSLTRDGPIPAHLLGSMSGNNWLSLYQETLPFPQPPSAPSVEQDPWASPFAAISPDPLNQKLRDSRYSVVKMFKEAEKWYNSMGFEGLPSSLWEKSLLSRPFNVDVFCHPPTAFDLKDGRDFRLKICAQVMKEDFVEAHRLLAHTYYQMAYSQLPLPFREGANPSFPQAIAEAAALAAMSPGNLRKIGLMDPAPSKNTQEDEFSPDPVPDAQMESHINDLYEMALENVAGAPFSLVVDFWRWGVYSGAIPPSRYNTAWWDLREKYQGLAPPTKRSEKDFDAGSNPAVSQQHFPAVRQFITHVLQFQILRSLCQASFGPTTTPLDIQNCNLRNSKEAGQKLKAVMKLGISRPWPEALEAVTGTRRLDASAMMEFYQPLMDWLTRENRRKGEYVGWDGEGTSFGAEVGKKEEENDFGNSFPTEDQVAFPGDPCAGGKQCLLSSKCNGTFCDCIEGTVFHDGICLPNDPEFAVGFGSGLQFNQIESVSTDSPETVESVTKTSETSDSASPVISISALCISFFIFIFLHFDFS